MTTPRPVPFSIARWSARLRWLRVLDAVAGALCLAVAALAVGVAAPAVLLAVTCALLGIGVLITPLRVRWRPVSAWVCLRASAPLRAGARAWYVRPSGADPVLVTARHGRRIVIARPDLLTSEGMSVRRTRVLLLPVDGPSAP